MKLLRVHIISAETCGGLLDGLDLSLRSAWASTTEFDPICLVGPNGSGKSQFLQILAEIFQSICHACVPIEERAESNPDLQFEIEYLICPKDEEAATHVFISRQSVDSRRPKIEVKVKNEEDEWVNLDVNSSKSRKLLPSKIVAYTSGGNETLSLPFLVSRSEYATEVRDAAFSEENQTVPVPDTRLMLIDYQTHLEVLVANLLMGGNEQRQELLKNADLQELHSFRCVVQLAHSAIRSNTTKKGKRKGVQLTAELEMYLEQLKSCATCYSYTQKTETYVFDFWVNDETKAAFRHYWSTTLDLYSSFHNSCYAVEQDG